MKGSLPADPSPLRPPSPRPPIHRALSQGPNRTGRRLTVKSITNDVRYGRGGVNFSYNAGRRRRRIGTPARTHRAGVRVLVKSDSQRHAAWDTCRFDIHCCGLRDNHAVNKSAATTVKRNFNWKTRSRVHTCVTRYRRATENVLTLTLTQRSKI